MSYLVALFFVILIAEYTLSEVVGESSILVVEDLIEFKYSF